MNIFVRATIALHIIGLAVISALESWRPGIVSSAVDIGMVWLFAVVLIGGLMVKNQSTGTQKSEKW